MISSSFVGGLLSSALFILRIVVLKILLSAGLRVSLPKDMTLIIRILFFGFSVSGMDIPLVVAAVGAQYQRQ